MRFPRVVTDADDTAAGRQLASGFATLRFTPELEGDFRRAYATRLRLAGAIGYGVACVVAAMLAFTSRTLPGLVLATLLLPAAFLLSGITWRRCIALAVAGLVVFWIAVLVRRPNPDAWTIALACTHGGLLVLAAALGYLRERGARLAYLQTLVINQLGERDGLTQLANGRVFDRCLEGVWQQCINDKALLVLLLIDVDNFRKFNDRYGLAAGDDCVRRVAGAVAASAARPLDFCARYSGVQFAVLLANPDRLYAEDMPARVRSAVAALAIPHPDSPNGRHVTVSVGVALTVPRAADSRADLLALAQDALREAHAAGGNRIAARESESSMVRTGMFRAEVMLAAARRG
jgi:diguanylate cyclase (GGDEF)-like protein